MSPEAVLADLRKATEAAFRLAENLIAAQGDDDGWTRLPSPSSRCHITGFSRSKVIRLIEAGIIRGKKVGASRFYSATDIRKHISQ